MAEPLPVEAPAGFSAELGRRLRSQVPQISRRMESAILQEVPRYGAEPGRYGQAVFQRCRLATRMFLRILTTGSRRGSARSPSSRAFPARWPRKENRWSRYFTRFVSA